jgi:poly(3-hydroxybutyrate) depolymerase
MTLLALFACSAPELLSIHDVAEGSYTVVVPDGVDPATAPALFHLHPNGLGDRTAGQESVQQALADEGLVGVFPQGWGTDASTDWNVGDNRHDIPRDDVAFLDDVAADVIDRYDPPSMWLGGASKGGAMTFELACLADESPFDGFVPMTGAIEKELPGPCTHPARPIRHLEGKKDDDHWPLYTADRPESSHMGIMDSFEALTTTTDGCLDGPTEVDGDCTTWTACAEPVTLCWYDGGHHIPGDWLHRQAATIRDMGG